MNKTSTLLEYFRCTTLFFHSFIAGTIYNDNGNVVLRVRLSARVGKRCPKGTESYVLYGLITRLFWPNINSTSLLICPLANFNICLLLCFQGLGRKLFDSLQVCSPSILFPKADIFFLLDGFFLHSKGVELHCTSLPVQLLYLLYHTACCNCWHLDIYWIS